MSDEITASPLTWPAGWPRTLERNRKRASYQVSLDRSRVDLLRELKNFGVGDWNVIISTNMRLRKDGMPLAGDREPADPGVAVYFRRNDKMQVMACDKWDKIKDNMRAVYMAIAALRQLERCGSTEILDRAFTGFIALPAPSPGQVQRDWVDVFGLKDSNITRQQLDEAYRVARSAAHPDKGGSDEAFQEVEAAYKRADQELKSVGR